MGSIADIFMIWNFAAFRSVRSANSETDVENILSTYLEIKDLINAQQMEVAVNGPDGATHLILCTGIANLGSFNHETFTFLVGPPLSRRQFVGAIASGALSTIQIHEKDSIDDHADVELETNLLSIDASYDDEHGQVKVIAKVSSSISMMKLAISYNVSILAELPRY
jgi:hypothetical protein